MSARRNDAWIALGHGAAIGRRDFDGFSNNAIGDMIDRAEGLGLPIGPHSPLDDLTLLELEMLTSDLERN